MAFAPTCEPNTAAAIAAGKLFVVRDCEPMCCITIWFNVYVSVRGPLGDALIYKVCREHSVSTIDKVGIFLFRIDCFAIVYGLYAGPKFIDIDPCFHVILQVIDTKHAKRPAKDEWAIPLILCVSAH